jgi:hypothetical protein
MWRNHPRCPALGHDGANHVTRAKKTRTGYSRAKAGHSAGAKAAGNSARQGYAGERLSADAALARVPVRNDPDNTATSFHATSRHTSPQRRGSEIILSNNKNPNQQQPGEKEPGKFHYNPGNMSGKSSQPNKDKPDPAADQERAPAVPADKS